MRRNLIFAVVLAAWTGGRAGASGVSDIAHASFEEPHSGSQAFRIVQDGPGQASIYGCSDAGQAGIAGCAWLGTLKFDLARQQAGLPNDPH